METRHYVAVMYKGEEGISVAFPDFLGCASYGRTIHEAALQAEVALTGHIGWMVEEGDSLPVPTPLDRLDDSMVEPSEDEVGRFLVRVEIPAKWVRLNVSMAETLVAQVDKAANQLGMSRSGFFAEAARRMLETQAKC
ncbi:MAG: type II toxin-antitoxin system HicB family antitoxin [Magnetococcales bacterium]|nr:type II toxin-antitoxin system HicB family antitoxin [Magnetococcales bacterium]